MRVLQSLGGMPKYVLAGWLCAIMGSPALGGMTETDIRERLSAAGLTPVSPDRSPFDIRDAGSYHLGAYTGGTFRLELRDKHLADLAVLNGMPIACLILETPNVTNLSPLASLPLVDLSLRCDPRVDLAPLTGKVFDYLDIAALSVEDLSVLRNIAIEYLALDPYVVTNGFECLFQVPMLKHIAVRSPSGERSTWTKSGFRTKLLIWGFRKDTQVPAPGMETIRAEAVSLCMKAPVPRFGDSAGWELTIGHNRKSTVMVTPGGGSGQLDVKTVRMMGASEYATLRECLLRNDVLSLANEYGEQGLGIAARTLCVRVGVYQKTIRIFDLPHMAPHEPLFAEVARLVNVLQCVQTLAQLPEGTVKYADDDVVSQAISGDPFVIRMTDASANVSVDDPQVAAALAADVKGTSVFVIELKGRRQAWKIVPANGTNVVVKIESDSAEVPGADLGSRK